MSWFKNDFEMKMKDKYGNLQNSIFARVKYDDGLSATIPLKAFTLNERTYILYAVDGRIWYVPIKNCVIEVLPLKELNENNNESI